MATEEVNVELEENDETTIEYILKRLTKHDSGAADLEKVTDYVEETEMSTQSITDAMRVVNDKKAKEASEKIGRERELSKVKINKDDVDLVVHEIEIPRMRAERVLREHKGNVIEALVALTN